MSSSMTTNHIVEGIKLIVEREIDKVFEEEKERIIERLDQTKTDIIARAALRISETMTVQDMGRVVRIEIIKLTKEVL